MLTKRAKQAPRGSRKKQLDDIGIDSICSRIIEGDSITEIAKSHDIEPTTLRAWLRSDDARYARARDAIEQSADTCDEQAFELLKTEKDVSRARELAHHLRWRAKIRNPKRYGDRVDMNIDGQLKHMDMTDEAIDLRIKALQDKNAG